MGWSLADQRARFSPAFIYNQINKGLDKGSFPQDGLSLLQEKGCVTIEDFPYDPDNYTKQPPGSLAAKAASFRIEKWARVDPKNTQAIKECLANSQPIIVGADCPLLFQLWGFGVGRLGIYAGMFGSYQGGETQSGGHAMCVVGYDDGKKAFKLINSWGANWGDAGFAWIDYASFGQMVREAYVTQDSKNNMALPGPPTPLAQLPKGVYRVRLTRWNWAEEDWTRLFNDDAHGIKLVIAKNGRNIFAPFRPLCGERGDHVVFADISWECEYDGTSQYTVELEECGPAAGLLDGGDVLAKLKMKRWQSAPNPWPWQARIMVGKSSYIETMVERR